MSMLPAVDSLSLDDDGDERSQELSTIATIFPELHILTPHTSTISIPVALICPLRVSFPQATTQISHFPPITIHFTLPPGYPSDSAPRVTLSTSPSWIPGPTLDELTTEVNAFWEEYGRSPVIFTIIDHVQQSSERAFGLLPPPSSSLELPADLQEALTAFDRRTKQEQFDRETYACGICLEPRKGAVCHRLRSCGHVFCRACLREYYSACIVEGDVSSVGCIDLKCKRAQKGSALVGLTPTLPPGELLEIGISTESVARYETLKLKGALEKDPGTIWCPRTWCQAASRESVKRLDEAMRLNHMTYYLTDLEDGIIAGSPEKVVIPVERAQTGGEEKLQKLHVCSKCGLAFCGVCYAGWHGDRQICRARNAHPTEEELANEVLCTPLLFPILKVPFTLSISFLPKCNNRNTSRKTQPHAQPAPAQSSNPTVATT